LLWISLGSHLGRINIIDFSYNQLQVLPSMPQIYAWIFVEISGSFKENRSTIKVLTVINYFWISESESVIKFCKQ
jgi:hypothetical protein